MDRPSLKQYDEYNNNNNNNNNNNRQSHHVTTYIDPLAYLSSLPPGYYFEPLPEELIIYYLRPKINNLAMPINLMHTVNIYDKDPDHLTVEHHPQGKREWYFLTSRNRKYPNGSRPNRKAGDGYWKATGSDKLIEHQGKLVGKYKSLVYFKGKPPNGEKTSWLMVEFRVDNISLTRSLDNIEDNSMKLDDYVLCKIYKNKKVSNKNDQQGQDEEIVQGNNKYQLTIGREIGTPLVQNATPSNQYYNDVVPGSIISFKNDDNNNVGSRATYYNTTNNNNNVSFEVYPKNENSHMICYNANNNNNNKNVSSEAVYHNNMDSQMVCYNAAAAVNNNNVSSEVVYRNNMNSQMICYNANNNNNNNNVSSEVGYHNNMDSQMICYNTNNNNNNNNVSSEVVYHNNVDSQMICYNTNNNNNNNVSSEVVHPNNMDSQVLYYNANNSNNNNNNVNSEAVYCNNTNYIKSDGTNYNDNNHKANHVDHQSGGHTIVDSMNDNYEAIFDDLEPLDIGYMNDFVFTV